MLYHLLLVELADVSPAPATPRVVYAACGHFVAMLPLIAVTFVVVAAAVLIICCAFVFVAIKIGCNLVARVSVCVCVYMCACGD